MKSKLTSLLAWTVLIAAMIGGNAAYAAMGEEMSGRACEDWSFNDSNCPAYIAPSLTTEGKPAFGAPSGGLEMKEGLGCEDWSFNTPGCSAYIDRTAMAGKPAFGEPSGGLEMKEGLGCDDWSFNDSNCRAYIR
ncbi:MAG: hypothetical protein AB1710_08730 [Pseudomonadota bacterium]